MSSNIFLIIALITTGIFVIQFILSIFFGDIDTEIDVDADISSVVSFKGLTHFGIGFGWYMYLAGHTDVANYIIGILIGLFFVLAVWFLYKKAYRLQQVNRSEKTDQLVGRESTIYFRFLSIIFNQLRNKLLANYLRNGSNDLATVRISAFCVAMLSNNSFFCKENIFFESTNCR